MMLARHGSVGVARPYFRFVNCSWDGFKICRRPLFFRVFSHGNIGVLCIFPSTGPHNDARLSDAFFLLKRIATSFFSCSFVILDRTGQAPSFKFCRFGMRHPVETDTVPRMRRLMTFPRFSPPKKYGFASEQLPQDICTGIYWNLMLTQE